MRKLIYKLLLTISIIGIPLFFYGILNTMISIKYETNDTGDCIGIHGQDLCLTIAVFKWLIVACIISIILLLTFRKKFLNPDRD
jgi:hypothetical protein